MTLDSARPSYYLFVNVADKTSERLWSSAVTEPTRKRILQELSVNYNKQLQLKTKVHQESHDLVDWRNHSSL